LLNGISANGIWDAKLVDGKLGDELSGAFCKDKVEGIEVDVGSDMISKELSVEVFKESCGYKLHRSAV
jgi:hypothetical protein